MQQTPNTIWTSGNRALDLRRSLRRLEMAAIALLAAVMVWGASQSIRPAAGQGMVCALRASVLAGMAKKYSEVPSGIGLAANGSVVEHLLAPDGSWTIIMTMPGRLTCIVATGDRWETRTVRSVGEQPS